MRLLNDWEWAIGKFVKVMPLDYRRVLESSSDRPRGTIRPTPAIGSKRWR